MPTTIARGFEQLKSNLQITGLQEATVSARQTTVREALEARLAVLDSFLTGSYRRSTMIAPLAEADIDIFVVLSSQYWTADGQSRVLEMVKAALKERYKTPAVSKNGQAVTIQFTDFYVDVVPAFNRQHGGYLIPDPARGLWISTDPKQHVVISSSSNKTHNGDLVPVVKMLKAWNREHGSLLRSFHLEVLTLSALNGVRIDDLPSGVRYVLDKARELVTKQNPDPAGYGGDVGAYLDTRDKIGAVVSRLESGVSRAVAAEGFAAAGRIRDAYDQWRLVFGSSFPTYG